MADEAPKTPIEKKLFLLLTAVTSLSAVIAAIGTFSKSFVETIGILGNLDRWQLGVISCLLLLVAVWSFVQSRRRRSILLKPEALRLDRTNPAHLKGRDDDLEYLVPLVQAERLIFLEGESGAGKSALLWSGLLPRLRGVPGLLPVMVESLAGDEWEHEPRRFLAAAFTRAINETLIPEQRKKLFRDDVVAPEKVMDGLRDTLPLLGRMPVLLVDQFDDYQNRFMDKFLIRKSWLKADALIKSNSFWADIKKLLDAGRLHCLVATRTDTAGGLASIRFRTPDTYRVDRLKGRFVSEIIDTLVGSLDGNVLRDPERGWTDLIKQLTTDLERGEAVLPQQLRIVLLSLGTLPHRIMTVGAFKRAGGVTGLEARFIQDCIGRVSRLTAVSPEQLRAILLTMVDPRTGLKTIEQAAGQIADAVPSVAEDQLTIALKELERLEVTRRRGDAGSKSQKWLLDHDYLARAVREVDRRANRWTRDLTEGVEKLGHAGASWSLWWQALLAPRTQLGFFADWLRGRFRYGMYRRYALISAARFAPYVFVLLVLTGAGILEYHQVQTRQMEDAVAAQLNRLTFDPIGSGYGLSDNDGIALVSIASMDDRARLHALDRAINDSSRRAKLLRQPEVMINAIVGTSMQRRNLASSLLVSAAAQMESRQLPWDASEAIARVANALDESATVPLSWWVAAIDANKTSPFALTALERGLALLADKLKVDQAKAAIPVFLTAIDASKTSRNALAALERGLAPLADKLPADQTKAVIPAFLTAIDANKTSPFALAALGRGLAPLADKLTADQAKAAIHVFLTAIDANKTSPFALDALERGLAPLADKLPADQAKAVIPAFLTAIDANKTFPFALAALGRGLAPLADKLTADQAKAAIPVFLAAIDANKTSPDALDALGRGLAPLADKLTADQAKVVIAAFLTAIDANNFSSFALAALGHGLAPLADKLTADQAKAAIPAFLTAIDANKTSPFAPAALKLGLAPLADKLTADQAKAAIPDFLTAIEANNFSPFALATLERGLGSLADKLTADQAKAVIAALLAAIDAVKTSPFALAALERGLAPLADKLTADQAKAVIAAFLAAIDANKTSPNALAVLGLGLAPLADKLTADQAKAVIAASLTAIDANETSPDRLEDLERGLALLADKLTADQAKAAIPVFLIAIDASKTSRNALAALERGLAPLADKLTADQAKAVIPAFLTAIDANKTSPFALAALGRGLAPLADKLTADQTKTVIAAFLTAVDASKTSRNALAALGRGLASLADKLTADHVKAVIPTFLTAIDANKTSPDALDALGLGLAPLADKLTADQAEAVIAANFAIVQVSRRTEIVDRYATLLAAADRHSSDGERVLHILRLLDHPLIGHNARESLMASLSSIAGPPNEFKGRSWDAIAWAEREAKAGRLAGYPPPPLFQGITNRDR
jgi:hypothetical protein